MLKIALDLDDTLFDWINSYNKFYCCDLFSQKQGVITRNVYKLKDNANFWSNLPLLERPNFTPTCYCTKRINSKRYTRANLAKEGLPILPIYQVYSQLTNKADKIKGVCDVLVDDSIFNVRQCLASGFPAILIDRPFNRCVDLPRVKQLNLDEITDMYYLVKDALARNIYRTYHRQSLYRKD